MRKITFTAQDEVQEFIHGLVQAGQYMNEGEVIDAALKLLEGQCSAKFLRLSSLIDEGLKSGSAEVVDEEVFLRELKAS